MALYILENFEYDWRDVAFPPLRLPDDYQYLCPNFDLTEAEEAARDFLLLKIPQFVFYVMVLNNVVKLGVLSGGIIEILESALVELRWSTFQKWVWCNKGNILRAHHLEPNTDREESSGTGDASSSLLKLAMRARGLCHHPSLHRIALYDLTRVRGVACGQRTVAREAQLPGSWL
ncbi:hypothetical protein Cgig2_028057 [Carnegiea gigantea]|uniref:Uncharacterized protein n=1 Tax=Carnegiea gigantea TaxID=171969 RepID=A0A9Q1Q6L4_9CARY|nr:hypothetical protein Cgig2_028057 [Carnegiea gigantea]